GPVLVFKKRRQVTRKIRFGNVRQAIAVEVRYSDTHACLQRPVKVISYAGLNSSLLEGPVVFVAIEQAGRHIAGDIDVRPAVIVEVRGRYSESVAAARLQNAGPFRYVGERSVAVVVVQRVACERQTARSAHHRDLLPDAKG